MAASLKKCGYFVAVGYLNDSEYWKELSELDIPARKFYHRLYGNEIKNYFFNRLLRRIDKQAKIWLPFVPFLFDNLAHQKLITDVRGFTLNQKIDLIHTNTNFIRDVEIFKIAKRLKLPVICHLRMEPYRQLTFAENKIAKYEKARFIAISKAIMNKWIDAGLPKDKIQLIYNAQLPLDFEISHDREDSSEDIPVKLLFVGRLSAIKGVDILIKSLADIDKKIWKLSIVGDGLERIPLEKLVKDRGLLQNVVFCGYQKEVKNFYAENDIVIVPSLKEPFGRVVIEAMQFAIPVIASDTDGPSEIIENGKDGFLFKTGDVEALKEAIDFLIKNPQKRIQIGENGREKQKLFSEEVFMEKLLKVYDSVNIK
jgi:glycosyltransferase involved in cell wall biosynthesis